MRAAARLATVMVLGGAVAVAAYHLSEAQRLHLRIAELLTRRDELVTRCQVLESQLADALRARDGATEAVADAVERERARRAAVDEHDTVGMPEGVRLALVALNDCLRDDEHGTLRFFFARAIEDHVLRGVELVERDPRSLRTHAYLADRVEIELQRDVGQLTIHLHDGEVVSGGERRPLVADGESIVLADVDGPLWEHRCGLFLEARGAYPPEPDPELEQHRHRLEAVVASDWIQRFDRLLAGAGTDLDLHVGHIGGIDDGVFLDVLVLGYDAGRKLALAAEASRMKVVTGPGRSVELLLEDGVLRRAAGDTTIPARGYSILLPALRPEDAMNEMLGMVERR